MITKQSYIEYLISPPVNYTCSSVSGPLDNAGCDVLNNVLKKNRITARQVWEMEGRLI